jgi:hypothetical protein
MEEANEIWKRMPGESTKAYAAFCTYRDKGPERSISKAHELMTGERANIGRWELWSGRFDWVRRAAAYDDHLDGIARRAMEAKRARIAERQASLAEAMLARLACRLESLDLEQLSPSDCARWLDVATKVQRLVLGEPTEIGKQEILLPNILELRLHEEDDPGHAPRSDESMEER